jgi:hypothetical protein
MLEGAATVTVSAKKIPKSQWSPRKREQWTEVSQIGWSDKGEYLNLLRMYLGIATGQQPDFCDFLPLGPAVPQRVPVGG